MRPSLVCQEHIAHLLFMLFDSRRQRRADDPRIVKQLGRHDTRTALEQRNELLVLLAYPATDNVEIRGKKMVEVQATAEHHVFDDAQLAKMLSLAQQGVQSLIAKQQAILPALRLRQ